MAVTEIRFQAQAWAQNWQRAAEPQAFGTCDVCEGELRWDSEARDYNSVTCWYCGSVNCYECSDIVISEYGHWACNECVEPARASMRSPDMTKVSDWRIERERSLRTGLELLAEGHVIWAQSYWKGANVLGARIDQELGKAAA